MVENRGLGEIVEISGVKAAQRFFEENLGEGLDRIVNSTNQIALVNEANSLLKSDAFSSIYEEMLEGAIAHIGIETALVQTRPTFRVQIPGGKSVSFHTDDISSGHGKEIFNFWVPLYKVNSFNTLHLVPEKESKGLLQELRNDKMGLKELDTKARLSALPMEPKVGQAICFSNRILHGTVVNESEEVRVSIDFRCIGTDKDLGTRVRGLEFIDFAKDSVFDDSKTKKGNFASIVFQSRGSSHIGHSAQRALISDFAARNNMTISRETSEWHHLEHYPVIEELLEGTSARSRGITEANEAPPGLLIFSRDAFDWNSGYGQNLMDRLKNHAAPVWFCLENEQVSPG